MGKPSVDVITVGLDVVLHMYPWLDTQIVTVAPMRGIYLHLKNSFTAHMCLFYIRNKIEIKYPASDFSLIKYCVIYTLGELSAIHFTIFLLVF